MHLTSSANVLEHAVFETDNCLTWPAALVDLAGALLPRPDESIDSTSTPREIDEAFADVRLLSSNLQKMTQLERELRGVPPNPKTIFLVTIIRAIFYYTMMDCAIWEFAEVVRPMHPLSHENPLAQWLPKATEASFLLLYPVSDFPSIQDACVDTHSLPASTDGPSSIGSHEESSSFSQSSPGTGSPPEHVSSTTSRSSLFLAKPHWHDMPVAGGYVEVEKVEGSERLSQESESSASAVGLDPVASQIHMLSDPTRRPMPLVGLLCMADVDTIFDVMASTLHQRRAWGITQPVVGLAFDRYETFVQVVFGWFDDRDLSPSHCVPLPRVAYAAPRCLAQENGGVFDLADPVSAAALATFLLGLREHIQSIQAACDARTEDVYAQITSGTMPLWRSDGPVPVVDQGTIRDHAADRDEIEHAEGAWREMIQSWAENVEAVCGEGSTSIPRPTVDVTAERSRPTTRASSKERRGPKLVENLSDKPPTSQKSRSQPDLPSINEGKSEDHKSLSRKESTTTSNSGRGRRYSCSEFARAALDKTSRYSTHPVYIWMLDRNAVCDSFTPTAVLHKHPKEAEKSWLSSADKHFKLYEEMTALYIPSSWMNEPPVQSLSKREAEQLKDFLFGPDVTKRRNDDISAGRIDKVHGIDGDSPSAWLGRCLTDCLNMVFQSLAHMEKTKNSWKMAGSVDEIAWRTGWDMIPTVICNHLAEHGVANKREKQITAWDTLERTLRLPWIEPSVEYAGESLASATTRAILYQITDIVTDLRASAGLAELSLSEAQEGHQKDPTPSRARALADAQNSYNATNQAVDIYGDLFHKWTTRRETLRVSQVLAMDPLTAKCDGAGIVRIEGFFDDFDPEWAKSFALVPRSKPPSTKNLHTEVDIATGRRIDALPENQKGKATHSDPTSSRYGMFVKRRDIPSTAHSDIMFSTSFRTAAHIEPALRSSSSDVASLVDQLQDTHLDTSAETSGGLDETDGADGEVVLDEQVILDEQNTLEIPILIREYKRSISSPQHAAANQGRMDLVAVIKFLGMLGIVDFPIFGLVTEGVMGSVICGWGEQVEKSTEICIRIIDRSVRGFDLTTVEGVVNYTSFVAKLHKEHAPKLVEKFKDGRIRAKVLEDYHSPEGKKHLQWNMTQVVEKSKGKQKA